MVKGIRESEWSTTFCPTRLMYSVMTGSSMNLAWRSTSAASWRPSETSLSSPPASLGMRIPLLMLRLPIMRGSSFSERGRPAPAGAGCAAATCSSFAAASPFLSFLSLAAESCLAAAGFWASCRRSGAATAPIEPAQRLEMSPSATSERENL